MNNINEKELKGLNGWLMLFVVIAGLIAGIALMAGGLWAETKTPSTPRFLQCRRRA